MATKTNYLRNKETDAFYRGQAFTPPATQYFGLLTSIKGPRGNSTVYALNDTLSVVATDGRAHLYKVTTAGTSNASQPSYPGVANEVIADGTAVMTEQASSLRAGGQAEVSGGSYARASLAATLANFAGTQSAGSTIASSGTNGLTSNNVAVTWPAPTANWGFVWGIMLFDAATVGNPTVFAGFTAPKTINSGDAAPTYPIAAYQSTNDLD